MTTDAQALIKRRIWMCCIWSWPVCVVVVLVGFLGLAGFVPPPREGWSAQQIADFYAANRTGIRVGLILALFGSALMLPFFAVISAEIRKIEGRLGLLAPIQFGGAVILVTFFQIIFLVWLLASFRSEADPQIVRAANDFCWLIWTTLIPTYSLQFVCMAIAGFIDKRPNPIWPRWAAYANLWVAVTGAGGVLAVFLKTGPFSWNGVMGFWVPVVAFMAGMSMTSVLLHRRARYEARLDLQPDMDGGARVDRIAVGAAI
jgi:hypothetical protein